MAGNYQVSSLTSFDIGKGIDNANQTVLKSLIALAKVSAGADDPNIKTVADAVMSGVEEKDWTDAQKTAKTELDKLGISINKTNAEDFIIMSNGIEVGKGSHKDKSLTVDVNAGGLVQLQFKIDQIMSAIQESIKNTGKVSQTREGAARA